MLSGFELLLQLQRAQGGGAMSAPSRRLVVASVREHRVEHGAPGVNPRLCAILYDFANSAGQLPVTCQRWKAPPFHGSAYTLPASLLSSSRSVASFRRTIAAQLVAEQPPRCPSGSHV